MENELREMITYRYGVETYREMLQMRRQIREQREKTIYKQAERRKALLWNSLAIGIVSAGIGTIWWLIVLMIDMKGG